MRVTITEVRIGKDRGYVEVASSTGKKVMFSGDADEIKPYLDLIDKPCDLTITPAVDATAS